MGKKNATKGYLFIANGRVVTREQEQSLEPVKTSSFEAPCIYAADKLGLKLYMGINRDYADQLKGVDYDITFYNQHIYRNIFSIKDLRIGYKNLCGILNNHPEISVIHCNTPIGGVLGRICGKKYHKKVIYTAHGFHFYKGAPFVNRTIFKFIEKWMAHYTDVLITINHEDYNAANKFRMKRGGRVYYVPGVGMDTHAYDDICIDKIDKRKSLKIPIEAILCIIVGDLNDNKNVETLIKALPMMPSSVHYIVCGFGPNEAKLKCMASGLGVAERCHFLGFRSDVKELYLASDVFLFASKREGLPRSIMEAMCAGLPCVVSKIRGNTDLIDEGKGGMLVSACDSEGFSVAITKLASNISLRTEYGNYNKEKVKKYDIELVKNQMIDIYSQIL